VLCLSTETTLILPLGMLCGHVWLETLHNHWFSEPVESKLRSMGNSAEPVLQINRG